MPTRMLAFSFHTKNLSHKSLFVQPSRQTAPSSATQGLHAHHVLRARERQLYDLQQELHERLERADARGERQQEDVEPGHEERHRPADEDEYKEPENGPQYTRAQATSPRTATLALAHAHLYD